VVDAADVHEERGVVTLVPEEQLGEPHDQPRFVVQ
jgi:hypothetical protein